LLPLNIRLLRTVFLILLVVLISFFETNSIWVEEVYYLKIYPKISAVLRSIFGWVPFSIGDALYLFFIFSIIISVVIFIKNIIEKKYNTYAFLNVAQRILNIVLLIFICFKLLWGLNYSRLGISHQLNFKQEKYCKEDVIALIKKLTNDANFYRKQIKDTALPTIKFDEVVKETKATYAIAAKQFPYLKIHRFSLKENLFSKAGNYLGYTGYYNPFTGEAQVRTDIPSILTPAIACHEVAHQLGYASEDEANFIAYLITNTSKNIYFRYSITLELLDYSYRFLLLKHLEDFNLNNYKYTKFELDDCADTQVKKDRKAIKEFFKQNKKELANMSSAAYDQFLKLNKEKLGVETYTHVVEMVLSYEQSKSTNSK